LEGNPALEEDWPMYTIDYIDEQGKEAKLEVPMSFADFAVTEGRFRKHFKKAPPETWNDDAQGSANAAGGRTPGAAMVPMHEFLEMDEEEREGNFPYIWAVDGKNRLMRILCSEEIVKSCEERRQFWRQLKGVAGELEKVDVDAAVSQAKAEMAQKLSSTLLSLAASGDVSALAAGGVHANGANGTHKENGNGSETAVTSDYEPVWVETPACTACDECIEINPKIFAYNSDKQAVIVNPKGGNFKDIVKAAEKCTAGCIHPGTPFNPNEKGVDKLIQRAEKFQ
ncbi:MAG: ferredoxin, partial [Gammaproteobacteria bacterium]|nr:ferredoxin [Gammaproteobacteria bacterium]MCW8928347.1 ferredoxin [Gammaproteobacteria bacterium]